MKYCIITNINIVILFQIKGSSFDHYFTLNKIKRNTFVFAPIFHELNSKN